MQQISEEIRHFMQSQLSSWPLARKNFKALKKMETRPLTVNGLDVSIQYNPSREASTTCEIDAETLASRPCFLCLETRPREQVHLPFEGAKGKRYRIQVNPYPILQNHYVIAAAEHTPQSIWHRIVDMLRLAKRQRGLTFVYNGPQSGASAPDHFHFQAVPSFEMPLENDIRSGAALDYVCTQREAVLWRYPKFARGIFVIKGKTSKSVAKLFYRLLDCTPTPEGDTEPRFNLYAWHDGAGYTVVVVLRTSHRSEHYNHPDPERNVCMSPGCLDMGGVFVTVRRDDFRKLDNALLTEIVDGVTISPEVQDAILNRMVRVQPMLEIELFRGGDIDFKVISDGAGRRKARCLDGRIEYGGALYDELFFEAKTSSTMFATTSFVLFDGDKSSTPYAGALRIVARDGELHVVNIVGIEDCLLSLLAFSAANPDCAEAIRLRSVLSSLPAKEAISAESIGYQGLALNVGHNVKSLVDYTWGCIE